MLKQDYKYYLANQSALLSNYEGKFLVIKNEQVIGVFDSQEEAYNETKKNHEVGTFLIQFCSRDLGTQTQTFHSRVSIAH